MEQRRGREDGSSYRDWDLSDGALEQLQVAERALEDAFAMSVADAASEDVLSMIVSASEHVGNALCAERDFREEVDAAKSSN